MDLRYALAALRASWWIPALVALLGGVMALGVGLIQTPQYTSTTQLFVSTSESASTLEAFQGGQFSQQRVASYAELLTGEELAQRVVDRLNLDVTAEELSRRITASTVAGTVLLNVSVTDPSARDAEAIAAAIGAEFPEMVATLEMPEAGGPSPVRVTVTDQPEVAHEPSSPKTVRNSVLGVLVGVVLGASLAILRARLDRSVKDPEETASLAGAPVIGTILQDESLARAHTIDRAANSRTAEDYRQLRTNLQFLNVDEPPKVIMVSSALPSEGKTTAVVNLGLALVDAGKRVIIVEADLRKPKVTRYLGMVGGVGLTNILSGSADLDEVLQEYGEGALSVVAAGPTPPNPGELLASSHMQALLDRLRVMADFVLVDAPPVLPVADASGLAVKMDGVLLSVRYGGTRKEQLRQAAAVLSRVGSRTIGVILNIVPGKAELASAYGYGYSYGYEGFESSRSKSGLNAPGGTLT